MIVLNEKSRSPPEIVVFQVVEYKNKFQEQK